MSHNYVDHIEYIIICAIHWITVVHVYNYYTGGDEHDMLYYNIIIIIIMILLYAQNVDIVLGDGRS